MKPRKTEHPILFSTPMVQAILEGRKTMTRRIVKPIANLTTPDFGFTFEKIIGRTAFFQGMLTTGVECPYGQPGDKLWVRESFMEYAPNQFEYKAGFTNEPIKWKPSIHMPKAAARIWFEITNVRVERLQDITREDAKNEGISQLLMSNTQIIQYGQLYQNYLRPTKLFNEGVSAISSFYSLWCKINGEESWNANPWVWVIEFKKVDYV